MTIKATPVTPTPISGGYDQEANVYSDTQNLSKFPVSPIRVARNSPPIITEFTSEMSLVYDKTTNKLWILSNGALHYVSFT